MAQGTSYTAGGGGGSGNLGPFFYFRAVSFPFLLFFPLFPLFFLLHVPIFRFSFPILVGVGAVCPLAPAGYATGFRNLIN